MQLKELMAIGGGVIVALSHISQLNWMRCRNDSQLTRRPHEAISRRKPMKMRLFWIAASLVLAFSINTVRSTTLTWNGSVFSDWNSVTNWPQQVPTNTDHVMSNFR